ncbi:MAG: hypothetical protein F4W92_10085 [Gammaproteobacteria bacterium]|nr:hypothetical protein [Gammaproteobacteria bacterium]
MNDLPIVPSSGAPPGVERRPRNPRSQSTGFSIGRVVFVLFTISALILLGWFVWSINSVLNERTEVLQESAQRIATLESQLSASAETLSQSDETMNEEISFWESETRKVWAGYQRHQDWINENTPVIAKMREDIDGLEVRINTIQGSLTDIENTLQQIVGQQRDLKDDFNTTAQTTKALLEQLKLSVDSHDDDIGSIDAFRRQTNSSILDIRKRLEKLETGN